MDLGANVGYTMADFPHRYPHARIIGIELDAANAEIAARNIEPFGPRCHLLQDAVWHQDGRVCYVGQEEWGFQVTAESTPGPEAAQSAPAFTIHTILARHQIDRVDYLKMDIEGAEASVLHPGAAWLQRVDSIRLEVHPPASVEQCARVLTDAGFACSPAPDFPRGLVAPRNP